MNFSEDLDVGTLYISTKFELDWFTNNGDISSDRNHWKRTQTRTETESDILPIRPCAGSDLCA